mgnify:CR=1 FL=1
MPLVDMPLEKLREYQGRNPRPDDFDEFWERALDEMRSVDPQVELIPADNEMTCPYADCFHLYFTGVRGARIHAKFIRPKNARPGAHPAVVQFHGYSGNAGDWVEKLPYAAAGFCVATMDCRGQGGLSQDTGGIMGPTLRGHIIRGLCDGQDNLLFRHIFLDAAQLAGIIMDMDEVDATRVGAMGGSQGGGLTLACTALEPRINRAAPMFPFLCDYLRVWEMDLAKDAYLEMNEFFKRFDPRHERHNYWFVTLGYIDNQHLAPRIRSRVLMATGLMDTVCPPSTQFAAYNKITSEKDMVLYPDFGHEALPAWYDQVFQYMLGM